MITPHKPQSSLIVILHHEHKALKRRPNQLAMAMAICRMELIRLYKWIYTDCQCTGQDGVSVRPQRRAGHKQEGSKATEA